MLNVSCWLCNLGAAGRRCPASCSDSTLAFGAITAAEEQLVGMGIYLVSFLLISLTLAGYPKAQDERFAFK